MAQSVLATALGLRGKKPQVPDWKPVDTTLEQTRAIEGNQQNIPALQKLGSDINMFNQEQILKMLRTAIPGYDAIQNQTSQSLQSQLRGEIPIDVQRAVTDNAAARALAGGYGGSGLGRNLTARDLGLTSLDITNNAINAAERWISSTAQRSAPLWDMTSMFITPQQRIAAAFENNTNQWNVKWLQNQIAAQPKPWEQAVAGLLDWAATTGTSVMSMGLGNMMGGGGFDQPHPQPNSFYGPRGGVGGFGGF